MGRNLDEMSVQALLELYLANVGQSRDLDRQADHLFFEAMAVPWWSPFRLGRLLDRSEALRREALRLDEENMGLAIIIGGRTGS